MDDITNLRGNINTNFIQHLKTNDGISLLLTTFSNHVILLVLSVFDLIGILSKGMNILFQEKF